MFSQMFYLRLVKHRQYRIGFHVKKDYQKKSGRYLVTVKDDLVGNSYVLDAWFWTDNVLVTKDEKGWNLLYEFAEFTGELRDKIVAWMPQPKPYDFEDT